jgi:hypothetical protein
MHEEGCTTIVGHFQWHLSNKKVGEIDISFAEYSISKSVHLTPDIVEYDPGANAPLYDLIIGKQSLHDIGAVLDFKDKTITVDSILLPMRNIVNLQLKPSVTRALRHNTCQAQEPVSTHSDTKRVIAILDAKYDKADLPVMFKTIVLTFSHHTERSCSNCCSNMRRSLMVL